MIAPPAAHRNLLCRFQTESLVQLCFIASVLSPPAHWIVEIMTADGSDVLKDTRAETRARSVLLRSLESDERL